MFKLAAILLTILIIFSGCSLASTDIESSKSNSVSSSSSQKENSSQVGCAETALLPIEIKEPGKITMYTYWPNSQIYEPTEITLKSTNVKLMDVIQLVSEQLETPLPIKGVSQQKGMVTIDFDKSFIDMYESSQTSIILNSLATTLSENCISFERLQLMVDGDTGMLSNDSGKAGEFKPQPLKLITPSAENFSEVRAKVKYEGLRYASGGNYSAEFDETGKKLYELLLRVGHLEKDAASPAEIPPQVLNEIVIGNTNAYCTNPQEKNYRKELKPISASVSEKLGVVEDIFWLKEHIEQTAKILFGEEFKIIHRRTDLYKYFEQEGVYTPPHMGGGVNVIPQILGYEDLGDRYKVRVAYIFEGMGGYLAKENGQWADINESDIQNYVRDKATKYEVVIKKTADGGLNFVSSKAL